MSSALPSSQLPPTPGSVQTVSTWLLGAVTLLGPAALLEPRISIFAVLLLVVGLAALTRHRGAARKALALALSLALVLALLGLGRFVLREALPGIVEASARASEQRAVSRLREILFAQDASRRLALIDPDGNGVGGAGRLAELTGASRLRPGTPPNDRTGSALPSPPLGPHFRPRVQTPSGDAADEGGYLYLVCVPGVDGQLTAAATSPVDEKAAERRFVAYAWPAHDGQGSAFFIDEYERILETPNRLETPDRLESPNREGAGWRLQGPERPPECQDALEGPHRDSWQPWRGKQPRTSLPGLD